jgi:hypothetical protein
MQSEKTVSVQVTYYLSPAGQRAALAAGLPADQEQAVDADVPPELWAALPDARAWGPGVIVDANGVARIRATLVRGGPEGAGKAFEHDVPPASGLVALSSWWAAQQAAQTEYAARVADCRRRYLAGEEMSRADRARVPREDPEVQAEALRREVARWMMFVPLVSLDRLGRPVEPPSEARDWPEVAAEFSRRKAEVAARRAALERAREEEAARKEAAAAAKAAREETARAWTAEWLREHGSPDQVDRFTAGVLPAAELREALSDHYLGGLVERFGRYVRLEPHEVCRKRAGGGVKFHQFETHAAHELTAGQWARIGEIHAVLPDGATADARVHVGRCADVYHPTVRRLSARVRLATPAGVEARVELALPE